MVRPDNWRFWLLIAGAAFAIMLGCWLSSGTAAPYGTYTFGECDYRYNGDHGQFDAVFAMLDGQPRDTWGTSVILRRILHPLLAYPFIKATTFETGGVIFNILSHGLALIGLALALRRYFDARAAVLACWLLASYPGYAYWAGLPYSYAWIVPGSIAATIALLWWNDRPSSARTAVVACSIGFIALGYDLVPYFGGGLLLMIAWKRRWRDVPIALLVLGAWIALIARGLPAIFDFAVINRNTEIYGIIIDAWLHFWRHPVEWGEVLLRAPKVFVSNFFFSGHVFLPALFLLVVTHHVRYRVRPLLDPVAASILLATLAFWMFLNLAPYYPVAFDQWQMRGTWIARLYQPWFVVVLLVVARASMLLRTTGRYRVLLAAVVVTCVLGWSALAGPYVRLYAVYMAVHQNFYQHSSLSSNYRWMHELGVRPIGVCK